MFGKVYVAPTVRWAAGRTSRERRTMSEDRSVSLSCEDSKMSEQSQDSGIHHSWARGASRFSYIRASNSFHSYGRRYSSVRSLEDSCSCSSREDLLGSNENLERSKKRRPSRRNMRRNKAEFEEVIAMYRGEKEDTTDSVFGSEDNLLEVDRVGCSSNISRFVRKHSVERMRQDSTDSCSKLTSSSGCSSSSLKKIRRKNKGSTTPCVPATMQRNIPQISFSSDEKSVCSQPEINERVSNNQAEFQKKVPSLEVSSKDHSLELPLVGTDEISHSVESTLDIDTSVPLDQGTYESDFSENIDCSGLLSEAGTLATSDTGTQGTANTGTSQPGSLVAPIRLRMHDAIVHTIRRIVDHLSSVRMQVSGLESRCKKIRETLSAIEHDQHVLKIRLESLEHSIDKTGENVSADNDKSLQRDKSIENTNDKTEIQAEHVCVMDSDGHIHCHVKVSEELTQNAKENKTNIRSNTSDDTDIRNVSESSCDVFIPVDGIPSGGGEVHCSNNSHHQDSHERTSKVTQIDGGMKNNSCDVETDDDDLCIVSDKKAESSCGDMAEGSGVQKASCVMDDGSKEKELLGRMRTRTGVSWVQVFTVSIMAFLSIAVWDINKSPTFKESHIGKGLDRVGLLSHCEVLAVATGSALRHAYRWCGTHIPVFYSRGCELAGPYLQLVWEKSAVLAVAMYTQIAALIDHLAQKWPVFHAKVEEALPGVCEGIVYWANIVYSTIQTHLATVISFTSPYLTQLQHFLTTRVFVGPLAPEKLYEHLTYLLQIICQQFAGIQSCLTSLLNPEVKDEVETSQTEL
ncbi:transmembrane protein 214 isoform X1 [Oratosquilla oratoria]|uniref:transmembrane protein 214 isoform X1 n=1 Tax=Oratosquilla oratoria TaxID=337810 RepID=UPI003F760EA1